MLLSNEAKQSPQRLLEIIPALHFKGKSPTRKISIQFICPRKQGHMSVAQSHVLIMKNSRHTGQLI